MASDRGNTVGWRDDGAVPRPAWACDGEPTGDRGAAHGRNPPATLMLCRCARRRTLRRGRCKGASGLTSSVTIGWLPQAIGRPPVEAAAPTERAVVMRSVPAHPGEQHQWERPSCPLASESRGASSSRSGVVGGPGRALPRWPQGSARSTGGASRHAGAAGSTSAKMRAACTMGRPVGLAGRCGVPLLAAACRGCRNS
jgi:hypothetical protein